MRHFSLLIFFLLSARIQAQEVQAAAGGYSSTPAISFSWTLGETISETASGGGLVLTQGFQQPHFLITAIKEEVKGASVTVYPNPTAGELSVRFISDETRELNLLLYNMNAQVVSQEKISLQPGTQVYRMNLDGFANGQYKLVLQEIKTNTQSVYTIQRVK